MIYTKKGDGGTTRLGDKSEVPKYHDRMNALGSVDELSSFIALFIHSVTWYPATERQKKFFINIQEDLFVISTQLSLADTQLKLEKERIALIEEKIDELSAELQPLSNFIVPGGNTRSAFCHVLRSICRRAERDVVKVQMKQEHAKSMLSSELPKPIVNSIIVTYLNRLSDLFFVWARHNNDKGKEDRVISKKTIARL